MKFPHSAARHVSHHAAEATRHMNANKGQALITRLCSFGMDLKLVDIDGRSLRHRLTFHEYSTEACAMIRRY